jgi:hypothetical protein
MLERQDYLGKNYGARTIQYRELCILTGALPPNRVAESIPEWEQLPVWMSSTSEICDAEVCETVQADRRCGRLLLLQIP